MKLLKACRIDIKEFVARLYHKNPVKKNSNHGKQHSQCDAIAKDYDSRIRALDGP